MATGTVKWFNAEKGYGFIVPNDGGDDMFVHITALQGAGMDTCLPGQSIHYEVGTNARNGRPQAVNVRLL